MSENTKFQIRFGAVFVVMALVAAVLTNRGMHVGTATFASLAIVGVATVAAYVGVKLLGDDVQ